MMEKEVVEALRRISGWTAWAVQHPGEAILFIVIGVFVLLALLDLLFDLIPNTRLGK
jgi:hypothetical protein